MVKVDIILPNLRWENSVFPLCVMAVVGFSWVLLYQVEEVLTCPWFAVSFGYKWMLNVAKCLLGDVVNYFE